MSLRKTIETSWQQPNTLTRVLRPISALYKGLFSLRKHGYDTGVFSSYRAPCPVIIVGNLTVGGTGKTPLLIHIVKLLTQRGYTPGVISRGYGGKAAHYPYSVTIDSPVSECGDEPALIVRRTAAPMMVGPNRSQAVQALLKLNPNINVVVSDDGLQHLALQRDIEVCLLDNTSPYQNSNLLPAGPFREDMSRLTSVDMIIEHGAEKDRNNRFAMNLQASQPTLVSSRLNDAEAAESSAQTQQHNRVNFNADAVFHAVAGIGNPSRFFDTCRKLGYRFTMHPFADHYNFSEQDLAFDGGQVLMTEKDAVKCQHFADNRLWFLPVDATLSMRFDETLLSLLKTHLN